ncbi:MAG: hypothetical protein ACKO45_08325 [Cyanobium sp.]
MRPGWDRAIGREQVVIADLAALLARSPPPAATRIDQPNAGPGAADWQGAPLEAVGLLSC